MVVLQSAVASADLGWRETEYVKRYGPATRSPVTPNQARFDLPGKGAVLVVFSADRSQEEAFLIDRDGSFVPKELMQQARKALEGTPVRRVTFQVERTPPAEIFHVTAKRVTVVVDARNRGILRVSRCRAAAPCTLIDRLLAMDRATDDLMARTERQWRRNPPQSHRH